MDAVFNLRMIIAIFMALYKQTWLSGMVASEFIIFSGFAAYIISNEIYLGAGFDFAKMLISAIFVVLFMFVNSRYQAGISFLIAMYHSLLGFGVLSLDYYAPIMFVVCLFQLLGYDGCRGLANGFRQYQHGAANDRHGNDSKRINSI